MYTVDCNKCWEAPLIAAVDFGLTALDAGDDPGSWCFRGRLQGAKPGGFDAAEKVILARKIEQMFEHRILAAIDIVFAFLKHF